MRALHSSSAYVPISFLFSPSEYLGDFPGYPVIKTSPSNAGAWVQSLVRELRYHMPQGQKSKHKTEAIL